MYARRNQPGAVDVAAPLLERARSQFEVIGMTGWIRRADELASQLKGSVPSDGPTMGSAD
jgi:hypothetical protein